MLGFFLRSVYIILPVGSAEPIYKQRLNLDIQHVQKLFEAFSPTFPSDKMFLFNKVIKHDFLIYWYLQGSRDVLKPETESFNTSFGAEQMLMHRKSCLIPICIILWSLLFIFYVPNFAAYRFGPVCPSAMCACVRRYAKERLEIGFWNWIHGISIKRKRTRICFLFRRTCHCNYMIRFLLWHCKHMESCEQNIWRTAWARIMIFGIQFEYMMQMTSLAFRKIL